VGDHWRGWISPAPYTALPGMQMKSIGTTEPYQPEIFIIETLDFKDEKAERFEGRIISQILGLSGKQCEYYYVRTKRELETLLWQFKSTHYRYLHLSCHGSDDSIFTTLDSIPFTELGPLLKPFLPKRRLFLSACSATNTALANAIMPGSGCYSILGPDEDIYFSDAAILWASFYHVMFAADSKAMKYKTIRAKAQEVSDMYRVRLRLIARDTDRPKGYNMRTVTPRIEPYFSVAY
jgi:hypothetical protein